MPRFFLMFSYIGTRFWGSQRQLTPDKNLDARSVQGAIESCLANIWPSQSPRIALSSRTDSGVHAFINTAHFDYENTFLSPEEIIRLLNGCLRQKDITDLCILNGFVVPEHFHARRSVRLRSYMYRIAVVNDDVDVSRCRKSFYQSLLPLVELQRCYALGPHFDIGGLWAALNLFKGRHNFAQFMAKRSFQPPDLCVDKLLDLNVVPGKPFLNAWYDPLYENLKFYEIHFHSRSFLYKQIRRMVGAAVAVGYGVVSLDEVRFILENPDARHWNPRILTAPADGLFLTNIIYDALDFEFPKQNEVTEEDFVL